MLRTRLVWLTIGFSVSAAAITQFVRKDLLFDRYILSSKMTQHFLDLEARVEDLESHSSHNADSTKVEG